MSGVRICRCGKRAEKEAGDALVGIARLEAAAAGLEAQVNVLAGGN